MTKYDNYTVDGKIHALSEKYAYILKNIDQSMTLIDDDSVWNETKEDFFKQYCEYIYSFDKEKCLKFLFEHLCYRPLHNLPQEMQFIYTPSYLVDVLGSNYGALALKFERSKNDNLDETAS
jgi:hypothetical protein